MAHIDRCPLVSSLSLCLSRWGGLQDRLVAKHAPQMLIETMQRLKDSGEVTDSKVQG